MKAWGRYEGKSADSLELQLEEHIITIQLTFILVLVASHSKSNATPEDCIVAGKLHSFPAKASGVELQSLQ